MIYSSVLVLFSDDCGDLWENDGKKSVLITIDKIIVAWDWDTVMKNL